MSRQTKYRVTYVTNEDRIVHHKTVVANTPMEAINTIEKEVKHCQILSVTPEYKFS